MKKLITILLLCLTACGVIGSPNFPFITPTAAPVYVVSTLADLDNAIKSAPSGSTIMIHGGVYSIANNGTELDIKTPNLTIEAYPGETPVIQGNYPTVGDDVWDGVRVLAIGENISGLTIMGFHNGIDCEAPSHNIVISNNVLEYNSESGFENVGTISGALQGCDYVTLANNIVHDNGYYSSGLPATAQYEGGGSGITVGAYSEPYIADNASGYHIVIDGNTVYHNYDGSLHTDGNGIIMDMAGSRPPTLIENNIVSNNGGKCIQIFGSQNVTVQNNTCTANNTDTLYKGTKGTQGEITGWASSAFPDKNITISNNNIYASAGIQTIFFPDIAAGQLTEAGNNFSTPTITPTLTVTPSATPSYTPSPAYTSSPSATLTPTASITPSPTNTATTTPIPPTVTPTLTATDIPIIPTVTPTPAPSNCPFSGAYFAIVQPFPKSSNAFQIYIPGGSHANEGFPATLFLQRILNINSWTHDTEYISLSSAWVNAMALLNGSTWNYLHNKSDGTFFNGQKMGVDTFPLNFLLITQRKYRAGECWDEVQTASYTTSNSSTLFDLPVYELGHQTNMTFNTWPQVTQNGDEYVPLLYKGDSVNGALWLEELYLTPLEGTQETVTATAGLHLRSGPATSYGVIETMPYQSIVTVMTLDGDWLEVTAQDGQIGWASLNYLAAQ